MIIHLCSRHVSLRASKETTEHVDTTVSRYLRGKAYDILSTIDAYLHSIGNTLKTVTDFHLMLPVWANNPDEFSKVSAYSDECTRRRTSHLGSSLLMKMVITRLENEIGICQLISTLACSVWIGNVIGQLGLFTGNLLVGLELGL